VYYAAKENSKYIGNTHNYTPHNVFSEKNTRTTNVTDTKTQQTTSPKTHKTDICDTTTHSNVAESAGRFPVTWGRLYVRKIAGSLENVKQ